MRRSSHFFFYGFQSVVKSLTCSSLCCVSVTGDGGGGDGSSGSEESGNDGGVSTIPVPVKVLTTYEALRGLGIVGSSPLSEEDNKDFSSLPQNMRNDFPRFTQV